jgi:hypothetical protein
MGVTRIHFAVDELVLNGFPTINRDRVAASFQRELTRLLAVTPVRDGSLLAAPADRSAGRGRGRSSSGAPT